MTTQLGFDSLTRDVILERVLAHADTEWKRDGLKAIAHLASTGRDFQADDLVGLGVGEPDHPNRWGGLFIAAARSGLIEHAGYAQSHRATTKGSVTKTWRGTAVRATTNESADVKAVSLARPWAALVIHAGKDIENRSWTTRYRGPLVIHASLTKRRFTPEQVDDVRTAIADIALATMPSLQPTGYIGVVDLVDICTAALTKPYPVPCRCGRWAQNNQAHWQLANPRPFPRPIPAKGRLGLFMPPLAVVDMARNVGPR